MRASERNTGRRLTALGRVGALVLLTPILLAGGCPLMITIDCPLDTVGSGETFTVTISASGGMGAITINTTVTGGAIDDPASTSPTITPASDTVTVTSTATDEADATEMASCEVMAEVPPCTVNGDCDDGDNCTDDTCVDNACVFTDVDCGDDVCDPANGNCVECLTDGDCDGTDACVSNVCTPTCTNDGECDDGVDCTDDACVDGACTFTANDANCDDGAACTTDSCNATTGCVATPDDAACDNGLFCDGAETCDPDDAGADADGCVDGPGDPCDADETCNEDTDMCDAAVVGELAVSLSASNEAPVVSSSVTLTCTQTDDGDPADSIVINQTSGPDVGLGADAESPATFNAPDTAGTTAEFECSATRGEEMATDSVSVTTQIADISVFFNDRVCQLTNADFNNGGTITSAASNTCGASTPPGLLATATSTLVENPSNIVFQYSCVSGPDGADDCSAVNFLTNGIPNNGTTVAQYTISPQAGPYTLLTGSGGTSTVDSMVKPGDWTFQVIATAGGQQATAQATYAINSGFDIFARAADTGGADLYDDTGSTSTFNPGDTSDDFPPTALDDFTTSSLSGIKLSRGELTNRTLMAGASIDIPFTALVRGRGGMVNFSLRDISGSSSIGSNIAQSSAVVDPAASAVADETTQTVMATIIAPSEVGTYALYAAFDSDTNPADDTAASPTDVAIHIQPDLSGTKVVTNDVLRAINDQNGNTAEYHGGEVISAGAADGGDELEGDIIIACDTDNDGIDELVIFDNEDGAGIADATILWTTSNPNNNVADNLLFNTGLPVIADVEASTTTIDLDTTTDQDGAAGGAGLFMAAACGDYNGDGYMDLLVGTNRDVTPAETDSDGLVALFYHLGDTGGLSTDDRTDHLDDPWDEDGAAAGSDNSIQFLRTEDASDLGWLFGYSLAFGDFVAGDQDDIIIGAPLEDTTNNDSADGNQPGTVYVIDGTGTLITANVTVTNPGTVGADQIDRVFEPDTDSDGVFVGASLALVDWSGGTDGKWDVLVGAPGDPGSADDGYIYLLNGGTGNTTLTEEKVWIGETDNGIGRRLVVCDLDGNGTDDFVTSGVGGTANIVPANGIIYAFYNDLGSDQNGNLTENANIAELGGTSNDNIGWRLACGDINGDGYDDIAFSAFGDSADTNDEVRVVMGGATINSTMTVGPVFDGVASDQPTDGGGDCGDGCVAAADGVLSLPFDALAIEDLNGDGIPDLLFTDKSADTLYYVCGRQ